MLNRSKFDAELANVTSLLLIRGGVKRASKLSVWFTREAYLSQGGA